MDVPTISQLGTSLARSRAQQRFQRCHVAWRCRVRSGQVEKEVGVFAWQDKLQHRQLPEHTLSHPHVLSRYQSVGNQAVLSGLLVELLVFEEMNVESSEGTVREEELVVASISGIGPSLAFI